MEHQDTIKELWVDKYRPTDLESYVLNADIKDYFKSMVKNRTMQHLTLAGCQGSGKTTLARVLANELNAEVLFVKCATEGTLDILRTKVAEFCNALTFDGKLKLVVLDELDSASSTGQNNFQLGLRTLIEAAQDDTRFICTANFPNKIVPAVLSRCPIIPLKFDKKDLFLHVKKVLDTEGIKYNKESMKAFLEESFKYYPDCRRIINYLQFCSNTGELVVKLDKIANSEKVELAKEIVQKAVSGTDMLDLRKFYMMNKEKIADYTTFATDVYNYAIDSGTVVDPKGILKMTDILFQLNQVIDKESQFFGLVVAIKAVGVPNGR